MTTIKTTTTRRGDVWYYVQGKRIGYCEACIIQEKNLREEIGTLFTVREGFAGNKGAQAMLNARIFTEKFGYSKFGFFFDTADDALDALKKLDAHFTDRLSSADITGDAEHYGNKRLAIYRKGNLEVDEKIFPEIENAGTDDTEVNPDDYAISEEAFNFVLEYEIMLAEENFYTARAIARVLADDDLAARYMKAKSQVKCELSNYGWRSWYFKGKNRTEWELDATKAAACLTRYGLSRWEFGIFHDAEVAVIESNGYDETAFDLLPNISELNDVDEGKTYTLTVYATEDFKELYGGNTLVKNFDTCQRLYESGKSVIFSNSWKLERAGKTIATGNGVKEFCRFITCEFDVSERLAEIADAKSVNMEICGENVYFQKGKFVWVMSPKYHAGFHAEAGIDGKEHYDIFTADKKGKFTRGNLVTEEEFFNVTIEHGGCTIEVDTDTKIAAIEDEISQDTIDKEKKPSIITVVEFINCFYNLGGGNFGGVSRKHQMGSTNRLA